VKPTHVCALATPETFPPGTVRRFGAPQGHVTQKRHRIRYGVPNPADEKYAALKSGASSTVTTPAEAAKPTGVVLLATLRPRFRVCDAKALTRSYGNPPRVAASVY
jgi:hypothetical protein